MSFAKSFDPAPPIRPMLNIGCLFDIPTGRYYTGPHGESILMGGLAYLTGVGGRGNTFKSAMMFYMMLRAMERYHSSEGMVYDTEMSASVDRMAQLAQYMDAQLTEDLYGGERFILTDKTKYSGNSWYDKLKELLATRVKEAKKADFRTLPIRDRHGNPIQMLPAVIFGVDSFSQFSTDSLNKIHEIEIGEAGRNVEALRDAMAKNQMIMELPDVTARGQAYGLLSAHMGDEHQLDPYAPPQKKLTFLKNKVKFKNVPEKFTFLVNNCWYAMGNETLINQGTKGPEYPRHPDDTLKGDPDLMVITVMQLRGKSGPTGLPLPIVVSQAEGVLPSLTQFHFIKTMNRFGLGGNDRNYYLELCPDIALSRTTVRGKIHDEAKLRRALEITAELCQIKHLWHHLPKGFVCDPADLYNDLKKKGYDWDILLDTRGYWVYEEEEKNHKPFLSTMDLLNMRVGKYTPWWYDKSKLKAEPLLPVEKRRETNH